LLRQGGLLGDFFQGAYLAEMQLMMGLLHMDRHLLRLVAPPGSPLRVY
jgi:hypothetical protein